MTSDVFELIYVCLKQSPEYFKDLGSEPEIDVLELLTEIEKEVY